MISSSTNTMQYPLQRAQYDIFDNKHNYSDTKWGHKKRFAEPDLVVVSLKLESEKTPIFH